MGKVGSWLIYVNVHRAKTEGLPWVIRPYREGWQKDGEDGCTYAAHVALDVPVMTINDWNHSPNKPLFLMLAAGELVVDGQTAAIISANSLQKD